MKLWRVVVDGWYRESPGAEAKSRRFNMLLEAEDGSAAFAAGMKEAESSAPMGPKWIAFEALSACTTKLPFHITP